MNEEGRIREFTDLKVWQESHRLVLLVYEQTKRFPREEIFGLTSQMRRSAVSVSSNIAEGFGRQGYKEKVQFYYLSQGSLTELKNQFFIARDISYVTLDEFQKLSAQATFVHRLLQGLIKKSKSFL